MSNYQLTIEIGHDDTQQLNHEGIMVALAKGEHHPTDTAPLWTAFAPFEHNVVTWDNVYGIYASPSPVTIESKLVVTSSQYPAAADVVYPYMDNVFQAPQNDGEPGAYAVLNQDGKTITSGLLQAINVNGIGPLPLPINAIALYNQQKAVFTPIEKVSVFLYQKSQSGTIVAVSESGLIVLDMAKRPVQTIHYNGNAFVPNEGA